MTPHKQTGGASFRIDRRYVGVGRIARSSGTDSPATHKRILGMLDGLHAIGRLDLLKDIRDGERAPLVVLHFYERGLLDKLPTTETAANLMDALDGFLADHEAGPSYKANLKGSIKKVRKIAGKSAAIADLPALVRELKKGMKETPIAFNRLRSHMLSFASEVAGAHSPLWVDIMRVNRFKKAEGKRKHPLLRRPLTVAELDAVCKAFEDRPVYKGKRGGGKVLARTILADELARMAYTLAFTGMRPAEYWQRGGATWVIQRVEKYIAVHGTKTAAADRPTFLLQPNGPPTCGEQFYRKALADATTTALRVGLDLYSLRRTFATFCESAKIEPSRAQAYLGHGPKTVTDLYLKTVVLPFVVSDAAKVAQWIESERSSIESSITLVREG